MAIEKCPKCGQKAFIKTPESRIIRQSWGEEVHIAGEHYWKCLKCKYKTEGIRVNNKMGDYFEKPWYKRIFSF